MTSKQRALSLLVVVAVTLAALTGQSAFAQTAVSWSVQPANPTGNDTRAHFNYDLKPGDSVSDNVAVVNHGDQQMTFRVYASDAFNTSGGGFDLLAAAKPSVDVGTWIKFASDTVTIQPRARVTLPFTLTVPANATPGDHAGGIVATVGGSARDASGSQVAIDYRVGTRIYLRVNGPLFPRMDVGGLHVAYSKTSSTAVKGTLKVNYSVENTGNVRFSGQPQLQITGPFGIKLKTVDLSALPEILPGSTFEGETAVDGIPPALRVSTKLVLDPKAPDGSAIPDLVTTTRSASVWAVPWLFIGALAVVIALLVLRSVWRRRQRGGISLTAGGTPE